MGFSNNFSGGSSRRPLLEGGLGITEAAGVSPTSVRVSWRLVEPEEVRLVDGFYILYRLSDSAAATSSLGNVGFTSITVLHAAATSYAIHRLQPFTWQVGWGGGAIIWEIASLILTFF